MTAPLAHQTVGTGPRTAWLLHGILGSGRNWRSFARRLADAHPGWRFVLPDLRNHGQTGLLPGPHDLDACAADLEGLPAPEIVIGHSFGGKVALAHALRGTPARHIWVLDSIPLASDGSEDSDVMRVLEALGDVPVPAADRREIRAALIAHGLPPFQVDWLLTSLARGPSGWDWVYGLEGIEAMMQSYFQTDYGGFLAEHAGVPVHLVRASRSARWTPRVLDRLQLGPAVDLRILPDADHWLHVDNPTGLRALLSPTLG